MRVAKCILYDGATDLCLVRLEAGDYAVGDGPVIDNKVTLVAPSNWNYDSVRREYMKRVEEARKVL